MLGLIVFSFSGSAQEGQGVSKERPADEDTKPAEPGNADPKPKNLSAPVLAIDTPVQPSPAANGEPASDQSEKPDLEGSVRITDAAKRSPTATEWQKDPTIILSIIVAIISVSALVYTVLSSKRAERIAKSQTRAYLGIEFAKVTMVPGKPTHFSVNVKNSGNSPATITKLLFAAMFVQGKYSDDLRNQAMPRKAGVIPPNSSITLQAANTYVDFQGIQAKIVTGEFSAYVFMHVEYRDVFGAVQALEITRFAYRTDLRAGLIQDPEIPDKHYEVA
ncbi:hypothetical protein GA830_15395 [Mesorhizobium sp. NBSH29]|uniref:hypothetical protein n=1 Tax=Mesorhizobium sp. NBSH29 TaxID=2654249 RepID=UPI0018968CD0|nr:hypothetical protein [Mesorhizobium sp. NBSH29]QPC87982.1 hypothetical protein GA830_15395 [Mesorhizobium sp. NBSH29]